MPSIIEAWRAGLFSRATAARNISAGIVVGVVALPLAMAFAMASGARPEQGLYTALVAGLVVTLFGGTRVQIAGPTGAFAVLLVGVTSQYGFAGLQVVTLMAGLMLLAFGLTRLGGVIRFIPESVILGFTAGIAVVIWVSQWSNFFGLPAVDAESFGGRLWGLIGSLPGLHPATTLLGLASLAIVVFWPKIPVLGKIPSPMVALAVGTAITALVRPEGIATIGSTFGGIPRGLPAPVIPSLAGLDLVELMRPAFAIALLGAIESLLSATVADGMTGTRHDPNQELVGQGLANAAAAVFGGFAATGAIARTATSVRHGADSPLAGIAHAATVAIVLVALAPLAFHVPLATLAAVLFVVAFNMSQIDRVFRLVRAAPRSDAAVMLVTLTLSVFTDLTLAVEIGVILAMLNFFRRMTAVVDVRALAADELALRLADDTSLDIPEGLLVYSIDGPFFFGATEQFERALRSSDSDPSGVIFKLTNVPFIDMTGLVALKEAVEALERRGISVALSGANARVSAMIVRAGIEGTTGTLPDAALAGVVRAFGAASDNNPDDSARAA